MAISNIVYGVPEQKKFPLPDADHIRSAIKFFNYVEPKYEKQLAKEILKRAKLYGVNLSEMNIGDNNRFKKYIMKPEMKHHATKEIHMYYLTENDYLEHRSKGWTKKNHKYISRVFKNGKWRYSYKNKAPRRMHNPFVNDEGYNVIQNLLGVDERDDLINTMKNYQWDKYNEWDANTHEADNPYYVKEKTKKANESYLALQEAIKKYYKTPIGVIDKVSRNIRNEAKSFIEELADYSVNKIFDRKYKAYLDDQKQNKIKEERKNAGY